MPIDKIIPRFLVSDKDQRLLQEGSMTDALNVTINEDGDGTEGVIKNVKGNSSVSTGLNLGLDTDSVKIIGELSDSQTGYIYFFVATVGTDHDHDAIYRLKTSNGSVETVFKNVWLEFDHEGFVKADLLVADFQQNGLLQSVLYFTDGEKQPRKINVDRAIAGDYESLGNLDYALNTIKGAPTVPVSTDFLTDTSLSINNFEGLAFQFALQNIFTDGEESAIGPYSKISFSDAVPSAGLEGDESGQLYFTDNVCEIDLNLLYTDDVSKVRLLARKNNDTSFFVIDEFNPNSDLFRNTFGSNLKVYDAGSGKYKFFNEQRSSAVPGRVVDKMFDNVPLKASGQALAGNRLFYSDYTEGFENKKITSTINVNYDDLSSEGTGSVIFSDNETEFLVEDCVSASSPGSNTYRIKLDFNGPSFFTDGSSTVPGGSLLKFSFDFRPKLKLAASGATGYEEIFIGSASTPGVNGLNSGSYTMKVGLPNSVNTRIPFNTTEIKSKNFSISYANPESKSLSAFVTDFKLFLEQQLENELEGYEIVYNLITGDGLKAKLTSATFGSLTGNEYAVSGAVTAKWGFDVSSGADNTELLITPYVKTLTQDLSVNAYTGAVEGQITGNFGLDNWSAGSQANSTITSIGTASPNFNPSIYGTPSDVDATESCSWRTFTASKTFKAGCSHDIGVVYYDEFNRNGFVNKAGSFYVDSLGERSAASSTSLGSASIDVALTNDPPPWAKGWQLVYGGMSSFSDYTQYTTGEAFPARDTDGDLLVERKQLFVSLDTIKNFKTEKNGDKSYSFTEGDKLRVVKYANDNTTVSWNYPLANDSSSFIEFNVVGFEILGDDNNPIAGEERALEEDYIIQGGFSASGLEQIDAIASDSVTVTRGGTNITSSVNVPSFKNIKIQDANTVLEAQVRHGGGKLRSGDVLTVNLPDYGSVTSPSFTITLTKGVLGGVSDEHQGEFIVIDAPQVSAGIMSADDTNELKYNGFDWFSVTGQNHPDATTPSTSSLWGHLSVVEILTPKVVESEVYYEIGERQRIGDWKDSSITNAHGPALFVRSGDSYSRTTACNGPKYISSSWNTEHPDEWGYTNIELESLSYSDYFSSRAWDKGRPHAVFEKAAEIKRLNGITYSDAYAEDVANLSLSSFNPSQGNFDSLEGNFGAINYLGNYNDDLVAIQENKLCLIPVNKNIIEYSSGSADVSVSTNVLGQRRYSTGDYGCSNHPEAVLIRDNTVYFIDESRQAVCALTGGQLVPISEKGMSSYFEGFFDSGADKYVSGYDPRNNTYYLSRRGTNEDTVGYDVGRGVWQSRYSFSPDIYSHQNNMMYTAKYVSGNDIFWKHDDESNHNSFYGVSYNSKVQVVSKMFPSRVKVFDAISYEGDSPRWEMSTKATTNLGQTSGVIHDAFGSDTPKFKEKEGSYYSSMPKDESLKYVYAGTYASNNQNVITVTNISRIDRAPFLLSKTPLYYLDSDGSYKRVSGSVDSQSTVSSFDLSASTITTLGNVSGPEASEKLYFKVSTDGDSMRGHFMTIELDLDSAQSDQQELYCINVHVTESKSHHPLGR